MLNDYIGTRFGKFKQPEHFLFNFLYILKMFGVAKRGLAALSGAAPAALACPPKLQRNKGWERQNKKSVFINIKTRNALRLIFFISLFPHNAMASAAWYSVYWSGLHIADVVVDINLKGKRYEAQSFLNTGGLIAMFSPMAIYSWSDGVISEQGTLPDYFHYHENDDGDLSQLDLRYDHNLPSLVDAKGKVIPFAATGKRPVVAEAKRRGSQNPLSLLVEFCNWAVKADGGSAKIIPVFDGKRLYNINGSIISHDESMVRARFVREPVDGYTKKELRRMGNLVFNLTLDSTNPMLPSDIRGTVLGGDARASLMLTCPDFMSCVKSAHITPPDNFSLAKQIYHR